MHEIGNLDANYDDELDTWPNENDFEFPLPYDSNGIIYIQGNHIR